VGGFSTVTIETSRRLNRQVAVKSIPREKYDQGVFFREIEALVQLNHPCVLRIFGWSPSQGSDPAQIQTELAEYGSLDKVLSQINWGAIFPFWNATGKGILICGIVLGMNYVHSKGYIHRDLKPSNILVNGAGQALISDFGTSCREDDDHTLTPECGTVQYAAPEQFSEDTVLTTKNDVFSFGLVLYEILTGRPVFLATAFPFPVLKAILGGDMPPIPDRCGSLMQDLIPRCWSLNPEMRPSFDDIIREFRLANFAIVPDADCAVVSAYVQGVLDWEAGSRD
jgi:serine/threonine protein kinase